MGPTRTNMQDRESTAIVLASGSAESFEKWRNRSWCHLIGSRLVLVAYGKEGEVEQISSRAPSSTELLCRYRDRGDDTRLEANRNAALAHLAANEHPKFVAFLDDDTFVDSKWLDTLLTVAKLSPDTGAFSSLVRSEKTNAIQSCGHKFEEFSPHDVGFEKPKNCRLTPLCPCGNCALVRWEVIENIREHDRAIWDPRFELWQTCFDFGLKFVLTGGVTKFVCNAQARHLGYLSWDEETRQRNVSKVPRAQLRSRYLLHRKFLPPELQVDADKKIESNTKSRWAQCGYPGFKAFLRGPALERILEEARAQADELWEQCSIETWRKLMIQRSDINHIWGLGADR